MASSTQNQRIRRLEEAVTFYQTRLDSVSGLMNNVNKEINEFKATYDSGNKEAAANIDYLGKQINLLKQDSENYSRQFKSIEDKLQERKKEKEPFFQQAREFLTAPYRRIFGKGKKKVVPGYRSKWGITLRFEQWLDKLKGWWQRLWVPGYYNSQENIYHMHQTNRAWNDFTKKNLNPLIVNYQTLRDARELGYTIIPFILSKNENYKKFIVEQLDTFMDNVLLDMKNDTLGALRKEGYDRDDVEKVRKSGTPTLSYAERSDIVNHIIIGAIDSAANAMYVAATRRFSETYGNVIPEIGREMRREVYTEHIRNTFKGVYQGYVFPFIHSYGQLIPQAKFTYAPPEATKENEEKKEKKATIPLKLFGLTHA